MKRVHESLHVIILNGLFSMSEIAVVSFRAARLHDVAGLRFEIVDMDRNRIDKLIVAHAPKSD